MKEKAADHPLLAKPKRYLTSVALVVVAVGLAGAVLGGISAMQRTQSVMMARATTAAGALSTSDLETLTGSEKDLTSDTYRGVKNRLTRIREDNPGMKFIYLMGMKEGDVFFYVDSEHVNSDDYSAPGELYPEASTQLKAAFVDNRPFIEGPLRDSYGSWISAIAPVVDETTGEVVAVLGIDVDAYDYYWQIATYAVIPLLLAAIPLTVLLRNRRLETKEREVLQLKTQFVSVASHELRSPLTGALWGIQSLIKPGAQPPLSDAQRNTLTAVYNSTASSLATVNEILDFSIFDRGKSDKMQRVDTDVAAVLRDVQRVLHLSTQEAGVTIEYVGDWPETVMVEGDPSALKRAFSNILSNAIKYSPHDSAIEITYKQEDGQHIIAIRDHGIGIPEKEQAKVLQGYYRATNASKKLSHGTGMGLWMTKLIAEQHKGKLWLESKENEGTTMYISLPVATAQQPSKSD